MHGLRQLSAGLDSGQITATELVEKALERAHQSKSVFTSINPGLVRMAYAIDRSRKRNQNLSPLAGIPIALKDLFNLRNEKTFAASVVRKHYAQAEDRDADVVAPLRNAGLLFFGRTNMSEFAFSGMGLNPHYGTPLSIWDRETGHLPGGSSSGSGVSVAEGVVPAALGSDTAGSCRIPAAFNGIVGVKPSHGRLSLQGIFPLSPSLDAPGPMAVDVDSCFILDQLMTGKMQPDSDLPSIDKAELKPLKLMIPEAVVMQDLDAEVLTAFEHSVDKLRDAGCEIISQPLSSLDWADDFFINRSIVPYEVWQFHREMLENHGEEYDPFVRHRMSTGAEISAEEQQKRYRERDEIIAQFKQQFIESGADALIYPTVASVPPAISDTEDSDRARKINMRCLRNTATINYTDGCSISLPCHEAGSVPVGFMISSISGDDERLYSIAATVELVLKN